MEPARRTRCQLRQCFFKKARTDHPSPGENTSLAAAMSTASDFDRRPASTLPSTVASDSVTDRPCASVLVGEEIAATASNKTPSDSDSPAKPGVSENISTKKQLVRVGT